MMMWHGRAAFQDGGTPMEWTPLAFIVGGVKTLDEDGLSCWHEDQVE